MRKWLILYIKKSEFYLLSKIFDRNFDFQVFERMYMHFERNPSNSHRAEKILRLSIKLTYILFIDKMPRLSKKINTISKGI